MDHQKENQKRVLSENQSILISLNTKLGLYIQSGDMQAFQILTRALNGIIDQRQNEMIGSLQDAE